MADLDLPRVFVTGATGYIGGRLVPLLLEAGYRVRCLARDPRKLQSRAWSQDDRVEIVQGDVGDKDLASKMTGCGPAYYLVHSMMVSGAGYPKEDSRLAESFAHSAAAADCERILYLGGLGETGDGLSDHLQSRRDVEAALATGQVPLTCFRAAMIIGAGSASFEILRYLVERLPVMVTPRWVQTECQPIGVRNVLQYLISALPEPRTVGETLDIGGPDVLTYRELMQVMAECLGLRRRLIVSVPVLTPKLSSLWIHLVTPLSHRIARPLAEGLRNRVVCRDDRALNLMPQPLFDIRQAIEAALGILEAGGVETSWSDAGPIPGDPDWAGGTLYVDEREREVAVPPRYVFRAVCRLGGTHGWYTANILWRIRGWIDRLLGGPGLRRGRRDAETLAFGDAVDFWRVTGFEKGHLLELRAEMKVPGDAWLGFRIDPVDGAPERCKLVQEARFKPFGLAGIIYWYSVLPFHGFIFNGMINGIAKAAEELAAESD
jgi:uncharacterized protein YbjT (DUF2867 family)